MIALTSEDQLSPETWSQVRLAAQRSNRTLVVIANSSGMDQLGWADFLESLGGAVPSWRALDDSYHEKLEVAARNERPAGFEGEAWRLFESLVADGLEFSLGRSVRRLGAAKRGQKVSDMIVPIPDGGVLVLDAKATSTSFDASIAQLRALVEYTRNQQLRQRGFTEVLASVVVSRAFDQNQGSLIQISREFTAQAGVPVAFLEAQTLAHIVKSLKRKPSFRSGLNWRLLFAGGLLTAAMFDKETEALKAERY